MKPEDRFNSLLSLEAKIFPAALGMAFDVNVLSSDYSEDIDDFFEALCDFLSACLQHWEWPSKIIVEDDRCISQSMLVTSIYKGKRGTASKALTCQLTRVYLACPQDVNLFKMTKKYIVALLDMALESDTESGTFCAALFASIYAKDEISLDEMLAEVGNLKQVEAIAEMLMLCTKDKSGLRNLFIVSTVAKVAAIDNEDFLLKILANLDKVGTALASVSLQNLVKADNLITLLNNLVYKHVMAKRILAEMGVHRQIVPVFINILGQFIPSDLKRMAMVTLCDLFYFVSTLTSGCPEAKTVLTANVIVKAKSKTSNLLAIMTDFVQDSVTKNDSSAPVVDKNVRDKVWIPTCFRIITASLTSIECRSFLMRSVKFMSMASNDLDVLNPSPLKEILWLDLLLSLTSFKDGQLWLGKNNELLDVLLEKADSSENDTDMPSLASFAILRNLAFNSNVKAKLLLLPAFLTLMKKCLDKKNPNLNSPRLRLCLTTFWALTANNHKAKVSLTKAGITKSLDQLQLGEDDDNLQLLNTVNSVMLGTEEEQN